MEAADNILRLAAIGVLTLTALRILWMAGVTRASVATVLFMGSVTAYMLASSRSLFPLLGSFQYLVIAGGSSLPMFFWWFSCTLFDDAFTYRLWHGLLFAGFLVLGQVITTGPVMASDIPNSGALVLHHVIALGLAFSAIFEAINSRAGDLIESRRQLRLIIVIGTGLYILMVLSVELTFGNVRPPAWLETMNAAGILALSLFLAPKFSRELYVTPVTQPQLQQEMAPTDRLILEKLLTAIEQEKLYREEALTITALADRLAVQEYRLRRLINQHLGYRNFNAFLNHYRISEAQSHLADISMARIPVLTIAMDLGYRSLSPFNRAFKEITGVTPTEYRREKLATDRLTDSEKMTSIPEST